MQNEMDIIDKMLEDPNFGTKASVEPPVEVTPPAEEPPAAAIEPPVEVTPPAGEPPAAAPEPDAEENPEGQPSAEKKEETPPIDKNKILEELSKGNIKSEEELNNLLEDYRKTKEFTESDTYQYASKIKAWEEKGYPTELFAPIQELDNETIDELSVEDTLKMKLKFENPEFSAEEIDLIVKEEYKQDPEGNTENTIKLGKLRMQREINGYKDKLKELKELTYVPSAENRSAEAAQQETVRRESWKTNLPKYVNEFNEVSVPLSDDGKDVFKYAVSAEDKKDLLADLERIITNAPVKYDEAGINALKNAMKERYINKNLTKISRAIAAREKSRSLEERIKKDNNPAAAKAEVVANNSPKKKTEADYLDEIAVSEGIVARPRPVRAK